jgi:hypothetical protein
MYEFQLKTNDCGKKRHLTVESGARKSNLIKSEHTERNIHIFQRCSDDVILYFILNQEDGRERTDGLRALGPNKLNEVCFSGITYISSSRPS